MPHLGEFTKKTHAALTAQADLHTPKIHASMHEDGGLGEISVTGLSGLLGDSQTPLTHGADKHTNVTRTLFATGHMYYGAGADISQWLNFSSVRLHDAANGEEGHVNFRVPSDFVSLVSLKIVVGVEGASGEGDLKHQDYVYFGAVGETLTAGNTDWVVEAVTRNVINVLSDISSLVSGLAVGDYVAVAIVRNGADADDTVGQNVHLLGALLTYVAEQ
jgi:hypothetical protein